MQDTSIVQPAPAMVMPPVKLGKLQASWLMTRQAFSLMMLDKEILAFPILSALTTLVMVGLLGALAFGVVLGGHLNMAAFADRYGERSGPFVTYAILFVIYLVSAFNITFFQAGLTAVVHARLQGMDIGLRDGLRVARQHAGKILVWAVISATVGVVLRIISDRSKLIGKLVAGLLGATWGIITLFIVPTLILEPGTVKDAIRSSGETFKKAWGETLVANVSIGLIMTFLSLLGVAGFVLTILSGDVHVILVGGIVMVAYLLGLSVVSESLSAVFRVVLYTYAKTGQVPAGFQPELVAGAMRRV